MGQNRLLFTHYGVQHRPRYDHFQIGVGVFAGLDRNWLEVPLVVVQEHHAAVGGNQSKCDLEDLLAERRDARAKLDGAGHLMTRAKLLVVSSKRGVVFDQLLGEEGLLREDGDLRTNQVRRVRVPDLETLRRLARLLAHQGVEGDLGTTRLGLEHDARRADRNLVTGSKGLLACDALPVDVRAVQ